MKEIKKITLNEDALAGQEPVNNSTPRRLPPSGSGSGSGGGHEVPLLSHGNLNKTHSFSVGGIYTWWIDIEVVWYTVKMNVGTPNAWGEIPKSIELSQDSYANFYVNEGRIPHPSGNGVTIKCESYEALNVSVRCNGMRVTATAELHFDANAYDSDYIELREYQHRDTKNVTISFDLIEVNNDAGPSVDADYNSIVVSIS